MKGKLRIPGLKSRGKGKGSEPRIVWPRGKMVIRNESRRVL
jgi:hypothetical protein